MVVCGVEKICVFLLYKYIMRALFSDREQQITDLHFCRIGLYPLIFNKQDTVMNKQLFLLLAFIIGSAVDTLAQDDLYFVPSKKKAKKVQAEQYDAVEYDDWAEGRNSDMDIDAYNRRSGSADKGADTYNDHAGESESFTNRIVRFHAPGITVVSSPYYTDYIDVYTDPWYAFYRPYSWYDFGWHNYYGWHTSWWWSTPYYWHSSWYDPWWGWHGHYHPIYYPGWHPHHGGHHHHYYPSRTEHRRPVASNRGYRPSTERGTRPSADRRPSQNRNSVSTNRNNSSTNRNTISSDRNSRTPSSSTVSPSRNERPQRTMSGGGGGSRPQRSMGGSGGRRR